MPLKNSLCNQKKNSLCFALCTSEVNDVGKLDPLDALMEIREKGPPCCASISSFYSLPCFLSLKILYHTLQSSW